MVAVVLPQFVPPKTVAASFGVTTDTAIRWLRNGKLPGGIQIGRNWFMRADALTKLLTNSGATTAEVVTTEADDAARSLEEIRRIHGSRRGR